MVVLFFLWLVTEIFNKKKEVTKKNTSSKLMPLILLMVIVAVTVLILPKLGINIVGLLQKFAFPIFSLLKTFIPF